MSDEKKTIPEQAGESSVTGNDIPSGAGCTGNSSTCGIHDPALCKGNPDECPPDEIGMRTPEGQVKAMEDCMGKSLEQLSTAFMASARRWELIVYPSLAAFVLLAGYGFFLIYSLTKDVTRVADSMASITLNMNQVAMDMKSVNANMKEQVIASNNMVGHMQTMNTSLHSMNMTVDQMRYHVAVMNNSVSRPMSFMNSFMPW